jgi:hypothetical protein
MQPPGGVDRQVWGGGSRRGQVLMPREGLLAACGMRSLTKDMVCMVYARWFVFFAVVRTVMYWPAVPDLSVCDQG